MGRAKGVGNNKTLSTRRSDLAFHLISRIDAKHSKSIPSDQLRHRQLRQPYWRSLHLFGLGMCYFVHGKISIFHVANLVTGVDGSLCVSKKNERRSCEDAFIANAMLDLGFCPPDAFRREPQPMFLASTQNQRRKDRLTIKAKNKQYKEEISWDSSLSSQGQLPPGWW
jgi:hypothetical protein